MSSSGLTRRRGAGGGGGGPSGEDGENGGAATPNRASSSTNVVRDSAPETSYESGENGHKIAFDPRDMSESAERSKQPKLTLMEEVLLLGLKDKQVGAVVVSIDPRGGSRALFVRMTDPSGNAGLPLLLERQHLVRSARLHRARARFPGAHQHAKGPL